jgi:hypothetical protein
LDTNGKIPLSQIPTSNTTGAQIQTDWEQNDKSQIDYIKNRPFYRIPSNYKFNFECERKFESIKWDGDTFNLKSFKVPPEIFSNNNEFFKVSE